MSSGLETEAPRSGPAGTHAEEGGVKDTIESIIVAFILAFIFRAFVVEAFVIPTGSMATTLLGAHMRFDCQDCGWAYDVNYQGEGDSEDLSIPRYAVDPRTNQPRTYAAWCPNCGYRVPREDPSNPEADATAPPVRYGDRILVMKFLYLLQDPRRWDVVVFKSPDNPQRYDYAQNYIKRLLGTPGENVMILDGDVYVAREGLKLEDFRVQTKPRHVQDALWRIVNDNDHLPRGLSRNRVDAAGIARGSDPAWVHPWKSVDANPGWNLSEDGRPARTFRFNDGKQLAEIAFNPLSNPLVHSFTDWLAYDVTFNQGPGTPPDMYERGGYNPDHNVSDVKVSFIYTRRSGDGPLQISLNKLGRTFVAELTPGKAVLRSTDGLSSKELRAVGLPWLADRPVHVEFQNVDYQVTLRLDGKEVFQTTPEEYSPDLHRLMDAFERGIKLPKPEVRIGAANQVCDLSHISVWRDVYYLNRRLGGGELPLWGSPDQFPRYVMKLGEDEYFVCGDNSPISGDARFWDDPIDLPRESLRAEPGRVPGRFLLGKAFFVYWPAGFKPTRASPAIVPNFGAMRFIH
jgi:signal peptidase I